jgi:hypothetical protein
MTSALSEASEAELLVQATMHTLPVKIRKQKSTIWLEKKTALPGPKAWCRTLIYIDSAFLQSLRSPRSDQPAPTCDAHPPSIQPQENLAKIAAEIKRHLPSPKIAAAAGPEKERRHHLSPRPRSPRVSLASRQAFSPVLSSRVR